MHDRRGVLDRDRDQVSPDTAALYGGRSLAYAPGQRDRGPRVVRLLPDRQPFGLQNLHGLADVAVHVPVVYVRLEVSLREISSPAAAGTVTRAFVRAHEHRAEPCLLHA